MPLKLKFLIGHDRLATYPTSRSISSRRHDGLPQGNLERLAPVRV
jgi:hypothetical protein